MTRPCSSVYVWPFARAVQIGQSSTTAAWVRLYQVARCEAGNATVPVTGHSPAAFRGCPCRLRSSGPTRARMNAYP